MNFKKKLQNGLKELAKLEPKQEKFMKVEETQSLADLTSSKENDKNEDRI